jgi:hypothetical protein
MPFQQKSGDSKLADAATARERDRTQGGAMSVEERVATLPEQVQDAAEQKLEAGDIEGADQSERMMKMLANVIEMMSTQNARIQQIEAGSRKLAREIPLLKCPTCQQSIYDKTLRRGICEGVHVYVRVVPKEMDMWETFPGITWNGVIYAGMCQLPPVIVQDVLSEISRWARQRKKLLINGGRVFSELDVASSQVGRTPII